ncbi:MAG TPA: ankyrin repeat domain-containing protein [Ornithinibacter sp.]|nr:ankyrin repeat domain-containing protein [Ornithinibacter sp.]
MRAQRPGRDGGLRTASALLVVVALVGCTSAGQPAPTARPSSTAQAALDAALRDAAWADDVEAARGLVARGADVDAADETQQSAYLVATSEGYLELLEVTLAAGADVDAKDSWNGTGLIRAAERGHHLVVGRLLRAGIDKDHVNRIGYQAVHEAVWFGADEAPEVATVQVLVAGGVELGRASVTEGLTPLEMARARGYRSLERVLAAADGHRPSSDPDAAVLAAAAAGDADAVALALRDGARLEVRDESGRTPLLLASAGDHVEVARVLVAMGADPDALDDQQDSPWLVTGVTGSVEMLEALLPASPDLGLRNRFGGVSVIPASERGHVDYVRRVVATGIDVNHVNSLGWTALLEAVVLGDGGVRHQEVVRILLGAGADPSIGDRAGITALEHAGRLGHEEIAAILRAGG